MNAPSKIGITVERRLDLFENQSSRAQYSTINKFYPWILPYSGLNNAFKDLADPPHFSPEIGATETFKESPKTAGTMASLVGRNCGLLP